MDLHGSSQLVRSRQLSRNVDTCPVCCRHCRRTSRKGRPCHRCQRAKLGFQGSPDRGHRLRADVPSPFAPSTNKPLWRGRTHCKLIGVRSDSTKHARRRHQRARIKQRVRYYYGRDLAADPRAWGLAVQTRQLCSGYCCGNPRRHFGNVTRQEYRADLAAAEELGFLLR
jgi:hypothetical protein